MKTKDLTGYCVVAVHAHPDDETLFMGGTLASLAARGAEVTVITLTLGEDGEVIGEPYQGLADHDQLGGFRARELANALEALGVKGIQLGGFGHFRDSGMAGSPSHENSRALVNRIDEAADSLGDELEAIDPHAILTYGPDGGYGHPDHIAVHKVVMKAASPSVRIWYGIFERAANYAGLKPSMPHLDGPSPARTTWTISPTRGLMSLSLSLMPPWTRSAAPCALTPPKFGWPMAPPPAPIPRPLWPRSMNLSVYPAPLACPIC